MLMEKKKDLCLFPELAPIGLKVSIFWYGQPLSECFAVLDSVAESYAVELDLLPCRS